eukprot:g8332.t1
MEDVAEQEHGQAPGLSSMEMDGNGEEQQHQEQLIDAAEHEQALSLIVEEGGPGASENPEDATTQLNATTQLQELDRRQQQQLEREKRQAARKKAHDDSMQVVLLEEEAVRLIGGEDAEGLTELANRVTNKIRSLGHLVQEEIEILVPKHSHNKIHRKMLFKNVPEQQYELALRWERMKLPGKQTMRILTVTVDKIGLLIGRGGSKVKEIQESTGAEVLIEPTDYRTEPPTTKVRVTGEDDKVQKAVTILEEILAWAAAHPREEAGKKMEIQLHHVPKLLKIPPQEYTADHVLYNLTKISSTHTGAENLKYIEEESGAEVEIDQTTGNLGYATVLIRGDEKGMAVAVDIITKDYIFKGENSHLFVEMGADWMVHPSDWARHMAAKAGGTWVAPPAVSMDVAVPGGTDPLGVYSGGLPFGMTGPGGMTPGGGKGGGKGMEGGFPPGMDPGAVMRAGPLPNIIDPLAGPNGSGGKYADKGFKSGKGEKKGGFKSGNFGAEGFAKGGFKSGFDGPPMMGGKPDGKMMGKFGESFGKGGKKGKKFGKYGAPDPFGGMPPFGHFPPHKGGPPFGGPPIDTAGFYGHVAPGMAPYQPQMGAPPMGGFSSGPYGQPPPQHHPGMYQVPPPGSLAGMPGGAPPGAPNVGIGMPGEQTPSNLGMSPSAQMMTEGGGAPPPGAMPMAYG